MRATAVGTVHDVIRRLARVRRPAPRHAIVTRAARSAFAVALTAALLVPGTDAQVGSPAAASSATLVTAVLVGSAPTGVAVNATTNRVYVANSGSGTLSVIDGTTNGVLLENFDMPQSVEERTRTTGQKLMCL